MRVFSIDVLLGHFLNVHEGPHGIGVRIGKLCHHCRRSLPTKPKALQRTTARRSSLA